MTDTGKQENEPGVINESQVQKEALAEHPAGEHTIQSDKTDERHDSEINGKIRVKDEGKADSENEIKEQPGSDSNKKKKKRNKVDFDDQRRMLKSEPVGNRKEKLNKVRIEFQKRIITKLGFFNSVRAQEKKWGAKKDLRKSRMDTQTAG